MSRHNPSDFGREGPSDRREFFRLGLAQALDGLLGAVRRTDGAAVPAPRTVLRPLGALPETEFLKTCYRCGSCVDACPHKALQPVQSDVAEDLACSTPAAPPAEDLVGTPQLDPDLQACDQCTDLPCVHACPSAALVPPSTGRP